MFEIILFSLLCTCAAWVLKNILTAPGMILWPLYNLIINKWKAADWIAKPTFECIYCMSGQWALWGYLAVYYDCYNGMIHILTITTSIAFAYVIQILHPDE